MSSRQIDFLTPEQVSIQYELAGVGSRALALLLDILFQLLFISILLLIAKIISYLSTVIDPDEVLLSLSPAFIIAFIIIGQFVIAWGYFISFETVWNGETPGKRIMGLRVIKDGGYPVDFRAIVIRNLLRLADALPLTPLIPIYGAGMITMLCHPQYRRLGDLAAGTLVVCHGRQAQARRRHLLGAVTFRLIDNTLISQLSRLTRDEYQLVQRFLERRADIPGEIRQVFAERIAAPLIEKFTYAIPAGMDYERWLEELDLAYRNRSFGIASPVATTPTIVASPQSAPATPPSDGRKW